MSVSYLWVGATTSTGAVAVARLDADAEAVRLLVSADADLSDPVHFGPVASVEKVARLVAENLDSDTAYHFAVEIDEVVDTDTVGVFRTHPELGEPADFTVAASSCAGLRPLHPGEGDVAVPNGLSNHPVFEAIGKLEPLMFIHMGDMHYYNIGSGVEVPGFDVDTYRGAYDDVFRQNRQHQLYRTVATAYVWDDHDFGPNNGDASAPGRDNACQVYRERVPHYELPDPEGIWQSWQVGRVLFAAIDVRSYRSPNSSPQGPDKTMLGKTQKSWLASLLADSDASFLILISASRWFDDSSNDTWDAFGDERAELIKMFDGTGWSGRMCIVSGDVHAVAIDTGGNSPGGIPIFQFAALDSTPHTETQDHYDHSPTLPGRGQYGTIRLQDDGDQIIVSGVAYHGENPVKSHKFTVETP